MSQVHDSIALGALSVQADAVKKFFKPHLKDFRQSSWYLDPFSHSCNEICGEIFLQGGRKIPESRKRRTRSMGRPRLILNCKPQGIIL